MEANFKDRADLFKPIYFFTEWPVVLSMLPIGAPPKRVLLTKQATKQNLVNEGNAETFREIARSEQTRSLEIAA